MDPSPADRAAFLERFVRFGAAPSVESYLALFHEDATLFDDGMERPIRRPEIPDSIRATLALIPGFVMVPERWRSGGAAVFVEARNEAKIAGESVSWRSLYRVVLEGSLVLHGRRFFDRAPLLARLDPRLPRLPDLVPARGELPTAAEPPPDLDALVARCAACWREGRPEALASLYREDGALMAPGLPRAIGATEIAPYYRRLAELLRGARLEPRRQGGDASLAFVEWEGRIETPRGAYTLGLVDRLDLVAGRILSARSYYDSAALARALSP